MNPALPVMAVIVAAGAVLLPRAWRIAWVVICLSGMAVLSPALALPDGIPSSAARLALFTPWTETGPAPPNDTMHFDVAWQIQPWLLYLRSELRAWRLPMWNPYQFAGMGFWSNGQSAPLFPLHLIFVVLPDSVAWVLLPWLRILVGGLGAWALARELGLGPRGSLMAAIVYPLSGLVTAWLLYPMANALILVPWVLWAAERVASGRGSVAMLGVAVGLQLLGGHPGTSAHTLLLVVVYLVVRVPGESPASYRELGGWGRIAAAWVLGGAIAAAHLLPFIDAALQSVRWVGYRPGLTQRPLAEVVAMLGRIVLPMQYGNPADSTWWGPRFWPATAIYVGELAVLLAVAGLGRARSRRGWDRRWLGVIAILVFSLCAAYELLGVGAVVQRVPVAGMAELRRLLFGVELALALLAGAGLDAWLAGERSLLPWATVGTGMLLGYSWHTSFPMWSFRDLVGQQLGWSLWWATCVALLVAGRRVSMTGRHRLAVVLLILTAADLAYAHRGANLATARSRLYPTTGAIDFLARQAGRVIAPQRILRPNAALVYGLYDVRGDDPMRLATYGREAYEPPDGRGVLTFDPYFRWDPGWLDRLDVRWVVTEAGAAAYEPDWSLAYDGTDARVWRRPSAAGAVRWSKSGTSEGLSLERVAPGRLRLHWRSESSGRVEIAEVYQRGWYAERGDGEALDLELIDDPFIGLTVGPGEGSVDLTYRTPGLVAGSLISATAWLSACLQMIVCRRRRRLSQPS